MIVLGSLMLGMLLAALDQMILGTALPTIVGEFNSLDHLSWVISAYLLTSTVSVPIYGKVSDIYGRKPLFQAAILLFVLGSALAGAAQDMTQLIVFRGLQGLGAGGIMAMAQAIVADVVTPRQRGRYQGYMSIVWLGSSVGGPLLGGLFTDHLGWRWIFFVNLPLGLAALLVTTRVLKLRHNRHGHQRIDFLGAALIIAAASTILLALTWGGGQYAWSSATIVGMFAAGAALTVAFVFNELRVSEPLLPLRLFQQRIFSVANSLGVISGMTMYGAFIFLPIYMQVVRGVTPTESGVRTMALIIGLIVTSIASGRLISATGRYRVYPILGTAVVAGSLVLLSRLDENSSWLEVELMILGTGVGMGLLMQTLVLAVQNSTAQRDMGIATASVQFFRSMGGAIGVAVFGAIFSNRVAAYVTRFVPEGSLGSLDGGVRPSPEQLQALPPDVHAGFTEAFSHALSDTFLWAVPLALLSFAVSFLLQEIPLRDYAASAREVEHVPETLG
jgi:EmrB/QacA subfamily drug resistance transporter